jgi:hypothetical protein
MRFGYFLWLTFMTWFDKVCNNWRNFLEIKMFTDDVNRVYLHERPWVNHGKFSKHLKSIFGKTSWKLLILCVLLHFALSTLHTNYTKDTENDCISSHDLQESDSPNINNDNILQSSHELGNDCISKQVSDIKWSQYTIWISEIDFTQNENDMLKNSIDLFKNSDFTPKNVKDLQRSDSELNSIIQYLDKNKLLKLQRKARRIILLSADYLLIDGLLFHSRSHNT